MNRLTNLKRSRVIVALVGGNSIRATVRIKGVARNSLAECIRCQGAALSGRPGPKRISTSYVGRQNLTVRMQMRRFTRLTNAFFKKIDNLAAAVAIHFMHWNFFPRTPDSVHHASNGGRYRGSHLDA